MLLLGFGVGSDGGHEACSRVAGGKWLARADSRISELTSSMCFLITACTSGISIDPPRGFFLLICGLVIQEEN